MSIATQQTATTADIALIAIGSTYARFGYTADTETHRDIVSILNDDANRAPEYGDEGEGSIAAATIRQRLWGLGGGGTASVAVTCNLFYALGRADELAWVANVASYPNPYGAREYGWFLRDLSNDDRAAVLSYTA